MWLQLADLDRFHQTSYQFYAQYDRPIRGCLSAFDPPMNNFLSLAWMEQWRHLIAPAEPWVLHRSNVESDPASLIGLALYSLDWQEQL